MTIEEGGVNATLPLVVSALSGLPVIDADGMGRAFPELQMVTYNVGDVFKGAGCRAPAKWQRGSIFDTNTNILIKCHHLMLLN